MRQTTSVPYVASDNSSARKNLTIYLIKAGFWIIIALVGLEICLRYFRSPSPVVSFDSGWGVHPVAGSTIVWRTEGDGINHYISDGEIATPYQGGDNIPVFGDSHTEAYQVTDNQNFVSVAETKLRGKGIMVDLRNLGYSGGSLADYTYWASLVQSKYAPIIVVIQISGQDFVGSGGGQGYVMSDQGNYFTKNTDGTLKIVHQSLTRNYGLLHSILQGKFVLLGYGQDRFMVFLQSYNDGRQASNAADETQPSPSSGSALDQKLTNFRAQLTALHTAYQGQRVIILVLPFSPAISEGQVVLEDTDYDLLLEQVKRFGDWKVVDPLPAFQALWLQDHKLPRGFTNTVPGSGHLNADGHAVVGQLLADKIEEEMR